MAETYKYTCKAMGVACEWTASGETEEDLMRAVSDHARTHDPNEIPTDLLHKVLAAIREQRESP